MPILPSIVVLIAVGIMVRLGFWQIDRMHQKQALLAQYAAAERNPQPLGDFAELTLRSDFTPETLAYRKVAVNCLNVIDWTEMAGRNAHGESGIAHIADCNIRDVNTKEVKGFYSAPVVVGWSNAPGNPAWSGGNLVGTVLVGKNYMRVVADPPLAGLQPNARPDPKDLPNNHWSYAIQWFLFAATALVIYGLALRKRLAVPDPAG